jgi:hypothetical protein
MEATDDDDGYAMLQCPRWQQTSDQPIDNILTTYISRLCSYKQNGLSLAVSSVMVAPWEKGRSH